MQPKCIGNQGDYINIDSLLPLSIDDTHCVPFGDYVIGKYSRLMISC